MKNMETPLGCPFFKPVGLTAAILGVCQGISWFVLSLLAIITYADETPPESMPSTYGELLSYVLWFLFSDHESDDYVVLAGSDLLVWSILYLTLSLLWVFVSFYLLYVIRGNLVPHYKGSVFTWGLLTLIISAVDFSLTIAFGVMRSKLSDARYDTMVWNAAGILMTIAARGYIVWLINILLAVFLIKMLGKVVPSQKTQRAPWARQPSYPGMHSDPWRNSVVMDNRGLGRSNSGYDYEGDGSIPRINPQLDYSNNGNPYNKSPRGHDSQPPIPAPDYSPPSGNRPYGFGQPALKSALKYPAPAPPNNRYNYPSY